MPAENGRLILLEGELTTTITPSTCWTVRRSRSRSRRPTPVSSRRWGCGTRRVIRRSFHPALAERLVEANILARADLCVAFLTVEEGFVTVSHPEHDGIRLPPGVYYCGRQVESAGEEERRVAD